MDFAVYPFKRDKKYRLYVKFTDDNGKQKALSTGVTYPLDAAKKQREKAQKKAEKKAIDILMEYFEGRRIMQQDEDEGDTMNLTNYLEDYYYPRVKANCANSTLTSYKGALGHFRRIIGDHHLDVYKRSSINKYKIYRYDKEDIRKTTINIEMRSIKTAFTWAYKNDFLDNNPFKGMDFLFDAKSKKREFKKPEIQRLLKQTEGQMIGLAIRLAYFSGMRIGEMTDITWRMVNLEERFIDLSAGITKTFDRRVIPLSDKAFNIVNILNSVLKKKMRNNPEVYEGKRKEDCYLLQKERGHGQYAKRSIQQEFRRCMNEADLPKELTFHCLRHSFATHVLENGGDLYKVSKILGHSTPVVTSMFYDHTEALNFRDTANLI